jgi:hypothetical protein
MFIMTQTNGKNSFALSEDITVFDCNNKNIVALMVEHKKLDSSYGFLSCFDYPKAYDRIDELQKEINDLIISEYGSVANEMHNNVTVNKINDVLESIASDVYNGNINLEECSINFYTQDEFLTSYVTDNFTQEQQEIFDSLFHWIESDTRGNWIYTKHIDTSYMYTNEKFVDLVFVVDK